MTKLEGTILLSTVVPLTNPDMQSYPDVGLLLLEPLRAVIIHWLNMGDGYRTLQCGSRNVTEMETSCNNVRPLYLAVLSKVFLGAKGDCFPSFLFSSFIIYFYFIDLVRARSTSSSLTNTSSIAQTTLHSWTLRLRFEPAHPTPPIDATILSLAAWTQRQHVLRTSARHVFVDAGPRLG